MRERVPARGVAWCACAAGVVGGLVPVSTAAASELQAVVRTGQAAPGAGAGETFAGFTFSFGPAINDAGDVAILAAVTREASFVAGIYGGRVGEAPVKLAIGAEVAPGTGGGTFSALNPIRDVSDTGRFVFYSDIGGAPSNQNAGVWAGPSYDGLQLVAREGDTLPGAATPRNLFSILTAHITPAGDVVGTSTTTTDGTTMSGTAIWRRSPAGSTITKLAATGDPAPGFAGGTLNNVLHGAISSAGVVAQMSVTGGGVTSADDSGVWRGTGGSDWSLIAREGSAAPGVSGGVFNTFLSTALRTNDAGDVLVRASMRRENGVTNANDIGLWLGTGPGDLTLLTRTDDVAPGANGQRFTGPPTGVVNHDGQAAVLSGLSGSITNEGIWRGASAADLAKVAVTGDLAPGLVGQRFDGFDALNMNDAGQIAFLADVSLVGGAEQGQAVYVYDPGFGLRPIAAKGMVVELEPGVSVTLTGGFGMLGGSGGEDGLASALNDLGHITFAASYEGGEAVFIATIPEPATAGLAAAAAAGLLLRRRRPVR